MEPSRKQLRLVETRARLPQLSQSAFEAVCGEIEAHGLPEVFTRNDQRKARNAVMGQMTQHGPLLEAIPFKGRKPGSFHVLNLWAFLDLAFRRGGGLADLVTSRHREARSSRDRPWRLLAYCDEVVPGVQLSHVDNRKFWAFYMSFLEFGALTLSSADAWFTVAVAQSANVGNNVDSGVNQLWRLLLARLFLGDTSPRDVGILLGDPDGGERLFVAIGGFVMDGAAHSCTWSAKGDGGMSCIVCTNFFTEDSGLQDEASDEILCCGLVHEDELTFATDATVYAAYDRLRDSVDAWKRGVITKARYEAQATISGFRFEEHGLMNALELRDVLKPSRNASTILCIAYGSVGSCRRCCIWFSKQLGWQTDAKCMKPCISTCRAGRGLRCMPRHAHLLRNFSVKRAQEPTGLQNT